MTVIIVIRTENILSSQLSLNAIYKNGTGVIGRNQYCAYPLHLNLEWASNTFVLSLCEFSLIKYFMV